MNANINGELILILQYAYGTLVMCNASKEGILNLNGVINWFEAIMGLYVNISKLIMFFIHELLNGEELLHLWVCKIGYFIDT